MSYPLVEHVFVLPINLTLPFDIFGQHLLDIFFQLEIRKIFIDETLTCDQVQDLSIIRWTMTKEKQLVIINFDIKSNK